MQTLWIANDQISFEDLAMLCGRISTLAHTGREDEGIWEIVAPQVDIAGVAIPETLRSHLRIWRLPQGAIQRPAVCLDGIAAGPHMVTLSHCLHYLMACLEGEHRHAYLLQYRGQLKVADSLDEMLQPCVPATARVQRFQQYLESGQWNETDLYPRLAWQNPMGMYYNRLVRRMCQLLACKKP
jgi:hypothetical protein